MSLHILLFKELLLLHTRNNNICRKNRSLALKSTAPFFSCISKINNVLIDNAEDLDIAMSVYNLI